MKRTRDREILALSLLVKTLRPLDLEARKRAIDYALNRLKQEDEGNMSVRVATPEEDTDYRMRPIKTRAIAGNITDGPDPATPLPPRINRVAQPAEDATLLSPRKTLTGE